MGENAVVRKPMLAVSPETWGALTELAHRTHRQTEVLASEALAEYAARELATLQAIERGRAEIRAGQAIPHEQVCHEARAIIEAARSMR